MTSPSVIPDQAVQALFAERTKYEGWISGLEMKRALTPTHIYDRVHADYLARLQRVIEQLHSHRAALQDMANALTDRLTEIDIEEAKHRDERAEADLRAAVGEYTPDQVTQAQRRSDEAIAALTTQRAGVETEVSKLRTVLDAATPAPAMARQLTPDTGVTAQPRQTQDAYESPAPVTQQEQFDDLEFLKHVVESPSGEQDAVPSAVGAPATPSEGTQAQPVLMSAERTVAQFAESPTPSRADPRATPSEPRLSSSFLKDVPPEQVKSLKCQECGTLNYPTEWYCERCGAELAAL